MQITINIQKKHVLFSMILLLSVLTISVLAEVDAKNGFHPMRQVAITTENQSNTFQAIDNEGDGYLDEQVIGVNVMGTELNLQEAVDEFDTQKGIVCNWQGWQCGAQFAGRCEAGINGVDTSYWISDIFCQDNIATKIRYVRKHVD